MIKSNLDPDLLPLDMLAIYNEWSAYQEEIAALEEKAKERSDAFERRCTHEHLVSKSHYFEGSYYDMSYTETWHECAFCSYKTQRDRKSNGHYG